jgi:hypothetical protein
LSEIYKNYLDYFTYKEWAGLLYIHDFHVLEFKEVNLDQTLQIFIEMLWVNEYNCQGVDLHTPQVIKSMHSIDLNQLRTEVMLDPNSTTLLTREETLTIGEEFTKAYLTEYYEKIIRALEKHQKKAELIDFYSGGDAPYQTQREHIYLQDDMSAFYDPWKPD